jgi:tape measure domain-containing protein
MARRDVTFNIDANVEGEQELESLARELDALGNEAGESSPELARLAGELRDIASQQSLVDQFRAQRTALDQTSSALSEARERTAQLAVELRNTEAPTRRLQNQFEQARRQVRNLAQAEQDQRLGLQRLRGSLQEAGISIRNLSEAQRRLNTSLRTTQGDVTTLRSRLQAAGEAGEDAGRRTERGMDRAGREARSTADEIRNLRDGLVGLFAADQAVELARHLKDTADQWTEINAKLKLVTDSQEDFNHVQEALFQISQESRTALAGNVALYARSADAIKRLGGNTADALDFTEALAKALKLSGASASEATSVQMQLSQGLASGVLRGEEFNAVMENGLRVSQALAAGLGVPVGALRALAEQGELTAERVIGALLSQKETLDKEYATIPVTVGGALQQLENQWLRLLGTQDQAAGSSKQVAEAIQLFAENLDSVLATAVTVGNAATIAARTVTLIVFRLVSNVVNAFDTLTLGAIDAVHNRAQALTQTVAAIAADIGQDFKDIGAAWEGVGQAAQKTNQEIEQGSKQAAEGLTQAGNEAENARIKFEPLKTEATALSKALQDLGIDAAQVTTGIRTEFSSLSASFTQVAAGFNAGNQVIALAAQKLALSAQSAEEATLAQQTLKAQSDAGKLSTESYAKATELLANNFSNQALAAIKAAQSSKELATALETANQHYQAGIITAEQYRQVQVAGQAQMNALAGATDKAAAATENLKSSMEGGKQAAGQMSQELQRTAKAADEVAQSFTSLFLVQREQFRAVSDEAAAMYDRLLEKESWLRLDTTDFFGALKEATEATQYQIDRTSDRYDSLISQLQSGKGVTEQFINTVASSVDEFNILGEQKLDSLRSEIDSARQKLQQLQDQAEQARESLAGIADQLQDELDKMAGNQEAVENRRYQQQLERIAELEKAGGEAASREAARAKQAAEELHRKKLADIKEEEEASRKADEERRQQESEQAAERQKPPTPKPAPTPTDAQSQQRLPPRPPPPPAPPKQVTKVIRVDFGNNRSLEIPADQESNLLDLLERSKRVT